MNRNAVNFLRENQDLTNITCLITRFIVCLSHYASHYVSSCLITSLIMCPCLISCLSPVSFCVSSCHHLIWLLTCLIISCCVSKLYHISHHASRSHGFPHVLSHFLMCLTHHISCLSSLHISRGFQYTSHVVHCISHQVSSCLIDCLNICLFHRMSYRCHVSFCDWLYLLFHCMSHNVA